MKSYQNIIRIPITNQVSNKKISVQNKYKQFNKCANISTEQKYRQYNLLLLDILTAAFFIHFVFVRSFLTTKLLLQTRRKFLRTLNNICVQKIILPYHVVKEQQQVLPSNVLIKIHFVYN